MPIQELRPHGLALTVVKQMSFGLLVVSVGIPKMIMHVLSILGTM